LFSEHKWSTLAEVDTESFQSSREMLWCWDPGKADSKLPDSELYPKTCLNVKSILIQAICSTPCWTRIFRKCSCIIYGLG
jgi:hypothetical protein